METAYSTPLYPEAVQEGGTFAGQFYFSLEDEDYEVVREVGLHYGFSVVKRQVAYACDMVVVVIDQFCAVFVGYEAVVLHF